MELDPLAGVVVGRIIRRAGGMGRLYDQSILIDVGSSVWVSMPKDWPVHATFTGAGLMLATRHHLISL
jgi:hypothetical protein